MASNQPQKSESEKSRKIVKTVLCTQGFFSSVIFEYTYEDLYFDHILWERLCPVTALDKQTPPCKCSAKKSKKKRKKQKKQF